MNYWKQFAEMLGLELGEKFELTYDDGTKVDNDLYKIEEDGLFYQKRKEDGWHVKPSITVNKLISGYCKAVPKPWKPEKGEAYWHYSKKWEQATFLKWEGTIDDLCTWKCGSCFRTEEEANTKGKEIMEQLQKEYEEE